MTSTPTMQSLSDILDRLFTASAPCVLCGRSVPVYTDPETGCRYCLTCLESAVEEVEGEMRAERQEMALLACWGRQIAA